MNILETTKISYYNRMSKRKTTTQFFTIDIPMLLLILVLLEIGSLLACPSAWTLVGDDCYYSSTMLATHSEAETACNGTGSTLIVIEDSTENDLATTLGSGTTMWIGLEQISHKNWIWVDGTPVTFEEWDSNGEKTGLTGGCVYIQPDGKWIQASSCDTQMQFICLRDVNTPCADGMCDPAGILSLGSETTVNVTTQGTTTDITTEPTTQPTAQMTTQPTAQMTTEPTQSTTQMTTEPT
ncbi:unnamed protein product, partial [Owenia fusiformis]